MSAIRGTLELSRAYLLKTMRSRSALIWTLLFPQVWLFMFALIFRNMPDGMNARMPGLFTITAFSGAFFGVAYSLVTEREQGILRRIWVTPATATMVVIGNAVRSLVMVAASLFMQGFLARMVLGVNFGPAVWQVAVVLVFGVWAFVPLGLIMGSAAKDMRSAPAISNLIFFPMVFMSGAALPLDRLPGWLQGFGRMLPTTYLVQALAGVRVRGDGLRQQGLYLKELLRKG